MCVHRASLTRYSLGREIIRTDKVIISRPPIYARGLYDEIPPMSGRFRSVSVHGEVARFSLAQFRSSLAHSFKRLPKRPPHLIELFSEVIDLVLQEFCWNPPRKKRFPIPGECTQITQAPSAGGLFQIFEPRSNCAPKHESGRCRQQRRYAANQNSNSSSDPFHLSFGTRNANRAYLGSIQRFQRLPGDNVAVLIMPKGLLCLGDIANCSNQSGTAGRLASVARRYARSHNCSVQ